MAKKYSKSTQNFWGGAVTGGIIGGITGYLLKKCPPRNICSPNLRVSEVTATRQPDGRYTLSFSVQNIGDERATDVIISSHFTSLLAEGEIIEAHDTKTYGFSDVTLGLGPDNFIASGVFKATEGKGEGFGIRYFIAP